MERILKMALGFAILGVLTIFIISNIGSNYYPSWVKWQTIGWFLGIMLFIGFVYLFKR